MPLRRLPSLSALRAFEAAARRMSFKAAADELSVTPSAISQQIRALESDLGVQLFVRKSRAVELTRAGMTLYPEVSAAFLNLRQAVDLVRPETETSIRINSIASVIVKWLLPRLHRFTNANPKIRTRIETEAALNPMERTGPDVVLRFGFRPPANLYTRKLFQEILIPVCSPDLLETYQIRTPEDVLNAPLLSDIGLAQLGHDHDWDDWFKLAGISGKDRKMGLHFDEMAGDFLIDAAIAGGGFALARGFLAFGALSEGRLVCPFGPVLPLDVAHYVACRKGREKEPHIKAFIDWAVEEAALLSTLNALHDTSV